jgi:hypothetical protein
MGSEYIHDGWSKAPNLGDFGFEGQPPPGILRSFEDVDDRRGSRDVGDGNIAFEGGHSAVGLRGLLVWTIDLAIHGPWWDEERGIRNGRLHKSGKHCCSAFYLIIT